MAKQPDRSSDSVAADEATSKPKRLIADEDGRDRTTRWRLGSWGIAATAALTLAIMAGQFRNGGTDVTEAAAAALSRKTVEVEQLAQGSQREARRLSSAVETLNADRDRLYRRLATIEQNLDSVTGSTARQETKAVQRVDNVSDGPPAPADKQADSRPAPAAVAMTSAPVREETLAPPDNAAGSPPPAEPPRADLLAPASIVGAVETTAPVAAKAEPLSSALDTAPAQAIPRTEFGLDLGGASTIAGLRLLWTELRRAQLAETSRLRPVIAIKQLNTEPGFQLRLVAGPIADAAAAAKLCVALASRDMDCVPALFDGQRLAGADADPPPARLAPRPRPPRRKKAAQAAQGAVRTTLAPFWSR